MKLDGQRTTLMTAFQPCSRGGHRFERPAPMLLMAEPQARAAFRLAQRGPLTAYSGPEAAGPGPKSNTRNQDAVFSGTLGEPAVRKNSAVRDQDVAARAVRGTLIVG